MSSVSAVKKLLLKGSNKIRKESLKLQKLNIREPSPVPESLGLTDSFIELYGWDGTTTIMIDPSMLSDHVDMIDKGGLDD